MGLRFFVVPVHDSGDFEYELNGFLVRHKVVSIDRHLIDRGVNSFWAICVDYVSHSPGETGRNSNLSRSRVDYKTILSPGEFVVFSRLRELRKELAQTEAVPVYALFTNEQLAQMGQRPCQSKSELVQIKGLATAKSTSTRTGFCRCCLPWRPTPRRRAANLLDQIPGLKVPVISV
jgi:HRDC domain